MSSPSPSVLQIFVLALSCLLLPFVATADEVTLVPVADATLYDAATFQGIEGAAPQANGAGSYFFAGFGNAAKRAVLRFDLSAIPPGSTIDNVMLTLRMSRTIAGNENVDLHRVTTAWSEGPTDPLGQEGAGEPGTLGDCMWEYTSYPTEFWTTPGGDFVALESATTSVGLEGLYTWGPTGGMAADVQAWVDDPLNNFGWILIGNEASSNTAKRFDSRENLDAMGQVPELFVSYTPAGAAPTEIPTLDPRALALLALLLVGIGLRLVGRG